jgi:hypothetical protein
MDLSLGYRQCLPDPGCPHGLHHLHETPRTVGVSEGAIGRIYAMCLSIRPLRDPVLTIRGRSGLVSNESADTAGGEQHRLSPRCGLGFMNYLSEQGFDSHMRPPSFIAPLLIAMMFDMGLRCFSPMMDRLLAITMREVGMVRCLFVMLRGFLVMVCG